MVIFIICIYSKIAFNLDWLCLEIVLNSAKCVHPTLEMLQDVTTEFFVIPTIHCALVQGYKAKTVFLFFVCLFVHFHFVDTSA